MVACASHVLGLGRYWIVTCAMLWIWGMQLYFVVVFLKSRRSNAPDPVPGQWRVAMVTTKTPSEPFSVVRKTLEAMLAQGYPHDTWLADEAPSAETRAWCERTASKSQRGMASRPITAPSGHAVHAAKRAICLFLRYGRLRGI